MIYGELLGKAGEYGVGYEHPITQRLALGTAASFAMIRGERITTATPYVHATLLQRDRQGMFVELGYVLAHSEIVSPVADWSGMSTTGGGGFGSLGYEYQTKRLVLRGSFSGVVGRHGVAPTIGLLVGVKP
ncbi:MAG: hypothetical protein QM831_24380 [Kofleriaceae bacterium]